MHNAHVITSKAVICFIDIVDSTYYAKIDNDNKYLEKIQKFEDLSEKIVTLIFGKPRNRVRLERRGDELLVIVLEKWLDDAEEISVIIENMMVVVMLISAKLSEDKIFVACGINVGDVVIVTNKKESGRLSQIYGHEINLAKRIETSSRDGLFSKIMLSKSAAKSISSLPIMLHRHIFELKNISNREFVFEVISGFFIIPQFDDVFKELCEDGRSVIEHIGSMFSCFSILKLSYIYTLIKSRGSIIEDWEKTELDKIFLNDIWIDMNNTDPIIFFLRAKDYENNKDIVNAFSNYIKSITILSKCASAKINICKLLKKIDVNEIYHLNVLDIIQIKLMAEEFLKKFQDFLKTDEKDDIKEGVQNINNILIKR